MVSAKYSSVATGAGVAVLVVALLARLAFPSRIFLGIPAATWGAALALGVSAIALARVAVNAVRRHLPASRLLVPLLAVLELIRLLQGSTSRSAMLAAIAAAEVALIAAAIVYLRFAGVTTGSQVEPEQRLARVLEWFLPQRVASLVACEVVVLWLGVKWIAAGFRLPNVPGFDYVEGSTAQLLLPVVVPVLCVLESVAWEILAHGRWPRVELALGVLDVWGILWCFGAYVAFKTRPHSISSGSVRLRRGIFGECIFPPDAIEDIENGPDELAPHPKGVGRLEMKGLPSLMLRFREPVQVTSYFRGPQRFHRVVVSASALHEFRNALLACRASRTESAGGST